MAQERPDIRRDPMQRIAALKWSVFSLWAPKIPIFYLFFNFVDLGPSQKIVGQIRGVFWILGIGYLGPLEISTLPGPLAKSYVRA